MHYIQENVVFCSTHVIFDKEFFSKYTNSHIKEYKLYNKLLDKISPETKLSILKSSSKDRPTPTPISPVQNNTFPYFSLFFLFYKSLSLSPPLMAKILIVEVEEMY